MKRLFLLIVAAALGVAAWLRLRRSEDDFQDATESIPSSPGKLGGEVDPELLSILACPLDKAPVSREGDYIVCSECGRRYPIRDGIPVMLVDEALLPETPPAAATASAPAATVLAPSESEEAPAAAPEAEPDVATTETEKKPEGESA